MAPGALLKLDDYRQVAPRGTVDFLMRIGERLRGKRLVHVSSSRYGALAEGLNRVVAILSDLGVETTWEITIGTADFDQVGRAVAKGLAGTEQVITEAMLGRLRETGVDNARRLRLDADLVMVHDAPPLGLVEQRGDAARWVWRCHHDLSSAQPQLWNALRPMVQRYDAAVFSLARFAAPLSIPRFIVYPAIDPLSERNREMTRSEQALQLDRLHVPRDKPILLQVGPFERQHDPIGVINAYRLVKRHHDVRLVLAGPPPAPGGDALGDVQEAASHDPDISVILPPAGSPDRAERARAGGHHRHPETAQGRFHPGRRERDVEGQAGDRHHRGRHPISDGRQRDRVYRGNRGGRRVPHPATAVQPRAHRPHGRGGARARAPELPGDPPPERLPGPARPSDAVMDTATLPDEVQAVVERLGGADVVVGLATSGPVPALAAVAAAVRTGLDAHSRARPRRSSTSTRRRRRRAPPP